MKTRDNNLSPQHALLGTRSARGSIIPRDVLRASEDRLKYLRTCVPRRAESLKALKVLFAEDCRLYYTLAAVSRRRSLPDEDRDRCLRGLYPFRSSLEKAILRSIPLVEEETELWRAATGRSFFGVSAKQGVSVRYGLSSCVPTTKCGGRCYGHDGRDRELHILFRAVLSQYVGECFEAGNPEERRGVLESLSKAIDYGIEMARREMETISSETGYTRRPRIRFSHIGEMAHTPEFTNALAREIASRCPEIACVIYTRHPQAKLLSTDALTINFTIEGAEDSRIKFAPSISRIVNSSWDGKLAPSAEVNFLEHHVEKAAMPVGRGKVCPVTANHSEMSSCDTARCELCFVPPVKIGNNE